MQNFVVIGQTIAHMAIFLFVKMATVCHLGFSRCGSFNGLSVQERQTASACQILWRSVKPLLRYGT